MGREAIVLKTYLGTKKDRDGSLRVATKNEMIFVLS